MTKPQKCRTPNCRHLVFKSGKSPFCSRCRTRRWKEKFPLHYSFHNLKKRAKERGHEFGLTREQYIAFAIKTDYARLKGKTSLSLSIDRIDNSRGYFADNIQAITLRENSRKSFVEFYAKQIQNTNYEPDEREIKEAEAAMAASENQNYES